MKKEVNRWLITGANGFVGKPLCAELLRQGHTVCAAVRATGAPIENIEMAVVGSIGGMTDWTDRVNAEVIEKYRRLFQVKAA